MLKWILLCGPAGWGLLLISIVVIIMVLQTAASLVARGTKESIKLRHRLNALIFWGFMGAVLGFIGQTSAIHNAMKIIIPAQSISPELIDRGFRESFIPSFWGFGIFFSSIALSFILRFIVKHGSENPGSGPLKGR